MPYDYEQADEVMAATDLAAQWGKEDAVDGLMRPIPLTSAIALSSYREAFIAALRNGAAMQVEITEEIR